MLLRFARFSSGPASPPHPMLWRPTLYSHVCLNLQICFSLSGFTTSVWIYHVEARIAQCLDSRLCVLGILVRFLTGSSQRFFSQTFKPTLDPTNLPTEEVRGSFTDTKQPERETDNYSSSSVAQQPKAGLGRLIVEVSRSHTFIHTHTHIHTYIHTYIHTFGRTPLNE
jgi:hypothetical protein